MCNRKLLARPALGLFAAVLAGLLFAPSSVQAECGDYVMIGGKAVHETTASSGASAQARESAHSARVPQDKHAPCSGPECSRQAPPSVPAPPAPVRNGTEDWGYAEPGQAFADRDRGHHIYEFTAAHPVHRVSPVYHPPR